MLFLAVGCRMLIKSSLFINIHHQITITYYCFFCLLLNYKQGICRDFIYIVLGYSHITICLLHFLQAKKQVNVLFQCQLWVRKDSRQLIMAKYSIYLVKVVVTEFSHRKWCKFFVCFSIRIITFFMIILSQNMVEKSISQKWVCSNR